MAGTGVVALVRTQTWGLAALLGLSACRTVGVEAVEAVEPSAVAASEPAEIDVYIEPTSIIETDPDDVPEPTPKPEPARAPMPKSTSTGWQPVTEPKFIQSDLLTGTANTARYALETEAAPVPSAADLHYQLDLRVRDDSTTLRLTEQDTGHALAHDWSTSMCSYDFGEGWGAGAALAEIAHDDRDRKLLEVWVTCRYGEDIVSTDSIVLIVLVDAAGLSLVWSGSTDSHGSHVCSEWSELEVGFEGEDLVIRESEVGAIFEPDEIPGYDCDEKSREYRNLLGQQRVKLP